LQHWFVEFIVGPKFARRLVLSHAIDDFADAMVNLSLVASLFLSVSLDASRSRIIVYLLLTAAPLVLVAPIVGNVLDRTKHGYGVAISGSQLLRAVTSAALIGSLLTVALYPLAFLVLISRKVYALAKSALLANMTEDPRELLRSDAHIARTGTIAGGIGTAIGGVLLATDHAELMLLISVPAFLLAALVSSTLPRPKAPLLSRSVPSLGEAIPSNMWAATFAVCSVRAAGGALTYLLAFAIKRGGGDEWIFASGLLAVGAGGLVANLWASAIHRFDPDWVLVSALLVPGVVCTLGIAPAGNLGILAIAFSIGLGRGVGSRSITILNAAVPLLARGRSIARSELLMQVASLIGAVLAVQFLPSPKLGFAVSGAVLVATGFAFAFRQRRTLRQQAARMLLGNDAPAINRSLPDALVGEAQRLAALGAYRMGIIVAAAAIEVLVEREPDTVADANYETWRTFEPLLVEIRRSDQQPAEEVVLEVLSVAERLLSRAEATGRNRMLRRQQFL